jgi:hypothetical protein
MKAGTSKEQNGRDQTVLMSEMAQTALKNYEQALRTGFKMQEEAGRWWSSVLNQAAFSHEWQKRFTSMTSMANSFMPIAQRRMEDVMELMEKNSRAGAELLKKAAEVAQTPTIADTQAKWLEFWASSMGAVRSNTEAVSQISSRAIGSWIDFVRQNSDSQEAQPTKST